MDNKVYISVITACYNGESFIEDAILSVLNQPTDCIELIVVDDGSTDNTPVVCQKYADKIQYIRTTNFGAGHARNIGLKHAKGTWVAYLDSDDLFLTNSFSKDTLLKLENYANQNADVIYTPWIYSDMELSKSINVSPSEKPSEITHIPKHEFWTCLYKRSYLVHNNINFYEYKEQDIATAFRYLVFCHNPIVITDNTFKFYLQRSNEQSNTHTWKSQIMHSVKCKVYYDLFLNWATPSSKIWLYEVFIEQLYNFYRISSVDGYTSKDTIKQMNHLWLKSLTQPLSVYQKMRQKRNFVKLFFWVTRLNLFGKESSEPKQKQSSLHSQHSVQFIQERLNKISEFLQ